MGRSAKHRLRKRVKKTPRAVRIACTAIVATAGIAGASLNAFASGGPTDGSNVSDSAIPIGSYTAGTPFSSGQTIEVTVPANSVFAANAKVNILECSDPGGLPANNPNGPNDCDGNTIQGDTVTAASNGSITYDNYTVYALPDATSLDEPSTSTPVCNLTNACVLYIGENQNDFSQPYVLSQPFWVATTSDDGGENPGDGSAPSTPTISTTPQPTSGTAGSTTLNDQVTISGLGQPVTSGSGAGTITANLYPPSNPSCSGSPEYTQTITASSGNGAYTTSPGLTANAAGTWYWAASYGGDHNNVPVSSSCSSEPVTVGTATPGLSTTPGSGGAVGSAVLNDSATLSGGLDPTGTVTFDLYAPSQSNCTGTADYTDTVTVSGDGDYSTSNAAAADSVGVWNWTASYSGDSNNSSASSSCGSESVTVTGSGPTLSTTPSAGGTYDSAVLNDSATLSGGSSPTGSIIFDLYSPSQSNCTGTPAYTDSVPVSGNGTYSTNNTSPANAAGTWNWTASYGGDSNNSGASSSCGSESVTVTKATQSITFTSTAPSNAQVGGPTYTVTATASSGLTVSFSIDSSATSVCSISGSTVSFKAAGTCKIDANQAGNSDYQAASEASQSFSVTSSGPAITSADHATATVGSSFSFEVTTSGTPTPKLKKKGALPKGLTFTDNGNGTGTISGTAAYKTGKVYSLTIEATFGTGKTKQVITQAFTLTDDEAPTITSAAKKSDKVAHAFSFTVKTEAYPAASSITETGALPSGVSFTNNANGTATLGGTPAAGTEGTYSITIKASNGIGTPGTQSFSLVVKT
jgi:Putative Ig domain